ncbi:MAG: NADP-specific glutamate dehydrogenase [Alphaproteobacteria bacterium]|nr:NADP-specific glutamate dehydrogenase [Alphaproteobacteria bacterium]
MAISANNSLENFMTGLKRRNPGETEFHQAVYEVASTLVPYIVTKPKYMEAQVLERLTEPDRIVIFRVSWEDDKHGIRHNRGYRVQCSNAIGPYKGGIRFHPSVTLSVLKFLAFEQTFINSLTGLPMGGGKGGADFNPKGKSDHEVMRFCQSFMTELPRSIGDDVDVPAGDIGVGGREIGYMFGQFKWLTTRFTGVLTGKGLEYGGSKIRTETTGYGVVYFAENMMKHVGQGFDGKTVLVSGSGNVATYAVERATQLGAKVVTMSDSSGYIYDKDGINAEKLTWVQELKEVRRGRIDEYVKQFKGTEFHEGRPWAVPCDIALPCATQNEINGAEAKLLIENGMTVISEGANMPSDQDAINAYIDAKVLYGPSKAANAGGVSVSGMEMSKNSARLSWSEDELQKLLSNTMSSIDERCVAFGGEGGGYINYMKGANIAGFVKVAEAMLAFGIA